MFIVVITFILHEEKIAFQIQMCYKIQTGNYPFKDVFNSADQQFSYKCQEPRCYVFIDTAVISAPRCGNDLAFARHVSKAAVLGSEVHTVWSSRAGQGEMLQKCDHEEEYLHASQGLSNTSSLSWEQRHQLCQGLELQQTKPQKRANLWALA